MLGEELLGRPVRWRGVRLGRVDDVILERRSGSPIGFEVGCPDGTKRFLALAACRTLNDEVAVDSPMTLLEAQTLAYYRDNGLSLLLELHRSARPGDAGDEGE